MNSLKLVLLPVFIIISLTSGNCLKISAGNSVLKSNVICAPDPSIPEGLQYTASSNGGRGALGLIGDVNDVLNGRVTVQTNRTLWTEATTGSFGFGAASIGKDSLAGIGEAVFVNGLALVRQTDNTTTNYFTTITGRTFQTPFSLFTLPNSEPDGRYVVNLKTLSATKRTNTSMSLNEFYTTLYDQVGRHPFCYFGLTQFQQLEAIAISKAPIYNEPLFNDKSYYSQPNFQIQQQYGLSFGCAARFDTIQDQQLMEKLSKLLYFNPLDGASVGELVVHSHAVSLKKCLQRPGQIDENAVQDVYHLLSNTTISFMDASVFVLNGGNKLVELHGTSVGNSESSNHLVEMKSLIYVIASFSMSLFWSQ